MLAMLRIVLKLCIIALLFGKGAAGMAVTEYILMNQDTPVLEFTCRRNEFDEPEFFEGAWLDRKSVV